MIVFSSIPIRCFTFSLHTPHGRKEGAARHITQVLQE
jgi:hypothetical protein